MNIKEIHDTTLTPYDNIKDYTIALKKIMYFLQN